MPILTVDRGGLIRDASTSAVQMFCRPRSHLLAIPLTALVATKEDRGQIRKHVSRCRRTLAKGSVGTEASVACPAGPPTVRLISQRATDDREACWTVLLCVTHPEPAGRDRQHLQYAEPAARRATKAKDLFFSVLALMSCVHR